MKSIVFILFFAATSAHAIINGSNANPLTSKQSVHLKLDSQDCSGVIVHSNLILTAGHCMEGLKQLTKKLRISNGKNTKSINLVQILKHPLYKNIKNGKKSQSDIQYDFAFIQTKDDLTELFGLSSSDLPMILENRAATKAEAAGSSSIMAYGFGTTSNSTNAVGVKKQLSMSTKYVSSLNFIKAVSLEKGRGVCGGDSGGGLFSIKASGQVLVGIVSGIMKGEKCGDKDSWAAYTLVSDHVCWIQKQTNIKLSASQVCN